MDTLWRVSFAPIPVLSSPPSSFFNNKPHLQNLKPLSTPLKTLTLPPLKSSHNPNPTPKTLALIPNIIKPTLIALTAAAAVFLSRHPKPSLAAAVSTSPPPPQTVISDDDATAEQALESRLQSDPSDLAALRSLMELKVKSRNLPDAIALADRLISLEPQESDLPLLKAHLQSYSGDLESAKLGFEEILQKNPYLVEAYHGLVMMASQSGAEGELKEVLKRVESAMEVCKKEKRKGELKDFKLLIAQVRVIEGSYGEALEIYQELVKEEPRDFRPYLCQGIIYTLLRKKDEAEKQFEKYRRLVPQGHPYAQFFDHNMNMMKGFSPME